MSSSEDENVPYTRWQGFRIGQLSLCISLFLTFSVATLGFSVNLLVQPQYDVSVGFARCLFFSSLSAGLLSMLFGSLACLTRLADFRTTAKVARRPNDADVGKWRDQYKKYGRCTWRLFISQLVAFSVQAIGLVISLWITYWERLT